MLAFLGFAIFEAAAALTASIETGWSLGPTGPPSRPRKVGKAIEHGGQDREK